MADEKSTPKDGQTEAPAKIMPEVVLQVEHTNDRGVHYSVDTVIVDSGPKGEQKIDRDPLFQVGRSVGTGTFEAVRVFYGGELIATLERIEPSWLKQSKWRARSVDQKEGYPKEFEGSETKRPKSGNNPIRYDAGPDMLKVVNAFLKDYLGDDFGVNTKSGSRSSSKYRKGIEELTELLNKIQEASGGDDAVLKALGITAEDLAAIAKAKMLVS